VFFTAQNQGCLLGFGEFPEAPEVILLVNEVFCVDFHEKDPANRQAKSQQPNT